MKIKPRSGEALIHFPVNTNFIYATNCDFGIYARIKNVNYLLVSEMDYGLVKKRFKGKVIGFLKRKEIYEWLKKQKIEKILLPSDHPYEIAKEFRKRGFKVSFVKNPFIEERTVKRKTEIRKIKNACEVTLKTFNYALKLLKKVRDCEKIKERLENYLFTLGYYCENLIVSSGKLSAIPHASGKGKVEEHAVIDVFPRCRKTHYHADFTRTVFLEKNPELESMLEACIESKKKALSIIRHGIKASDVYNVICDVLEEFGYTTTRKNVKEGFIHAAGHGIGLEVHEPPTITSEVNQHLKKGMVLAIEPGLYYKKLGGVRTEDTIIVRKNRAEILTPFREMVKI